MAEDHLTDEQLLRQSPLFDAAYYRRTYPDVLESGMGPVKHYLQHGWRERRDPSALFSTSSYLDAYPDVASAGMNPLVHYLRAGEAEGRSANPFEDDVTLVAESGFFDEEYYLHFHPEVPPGRDAVRHYVRHAAEEGLDPSEAFSTTAYLAQNPDVAPTNPLVHYLRHGRAEGRLAVRGRLLKPYFDRLYAQRWPDLVPLTVATLPDQGPRVTVLTDSVAPSSLFGGVGTALILGMMLANSRGGPLRLATRSEEPDPRVVGLLERASGVRLETPLELAHLPLDGSGQLTMGEEDVLITTSWWTTRAALGSTLSRDRIVYLLQEDERMFYPYGDERLLCSETLGERGLHVVVNTRRLLDHLALPSGFPDLASTALSFEPAFPGIRSDDVPAAPAAPAALAEEDGRLNFFFYSRPANSRNLFWRGGEAIARAVENGILHPDEWRIHLVGRNTPDLTFPRDVKPDIIEGLAWTDYQALVSRMDGALVLMDTPHPSYPPLDLAAAGAAVLTNTHPGKEDLSGLSQNILTAAPTLDSLVEGLRAMTALARDRDRRAENVRRDTIGRDWSEALAPVVDTLVGRFTEQAGADVR